LPQVVTSDSVHALEHSLEVHLPFLQSVLDAFHLVPFAVGHASPEEVAEVLERLWGGPETLIVVSSDLSHYLPYATAREVDRQTVAAILGLNAVIDHEQACGGTPVNGLLLAARRHGLHPRLLDLRNSGDTAGDRSRVVGYCSIAFDEAVGHVA
jgi:AmmeMemoRadiSam system protein B